MSDADLSASQWLATAADALELDPEVIRELTGDLLDLTRDVAHGPSRPAAPLTAFLVGLSTGRATSAGDDAEDTVAQARERIQELQRKLGTQE